MANYNSVVAIFQYPNVLQNFMNDVIMTKDPLLWWLHGKPVNTGAGLKPTAKKFLREVDGGSQFEVPLLLQLNPNMKNFAKDDTFNMGSNDAGDRAIYQIRHTGGPIIMYGTDINTCQNTNAAIKDLQKTYLEQGSTTMMNIMSQNMWRAAGTEGANDWTAIQTSISATPTADNIGGISSAAYPNWANVATDETSTSLASYVVREFNKGMINATVGVDRPKLITCTTNIYSNLFVNEQGLQRFSPDAELAKIGFDALNFMGVPVFYNNAMNGYDANGNINTADGQIAIGINPEAFEYGVLKSENMKVEPPVRVPNGYSFASFIAHGGNLYPRNRRTNFILSNFGKVA